MAQSIEGKFNEVVSALTETQQEKFFGEVERLKQENGEKPSIETQLNIAESIAAKAGPVRRNNGAGTWVTESDRKLGNLRESQVQAYVQMGHSKEIAERMAGLAPASEEATSLSEAERQQYHFGKAIGLNESEALRFAKVRALD
jgi:hypothetical protein